MVKKEKEKDNKRIERKQAEVIHKGSPTNKKQTVEEVNRQRGNYPSSYNRIED